MKSFQDVVRIRERLSATDPHDVRVRGRLASARRAMAGLLAKLGDDSGALSQSLQAAAILEPLVLANPEDQTDRAQLAEANWKAGQAEARLAVTSGSGSAEAARRQSRACALFERASAEYRELERRSGSSDDDKANAKLVQRLASDCAKPS